MKTKTEFMNTLKDLNRILQAHHQGRKKTEFIEEGIGISQLRSDGEAVLNTKVLEAFCKEIGLTHEKQCAYDSQQNGKVDNKISNIWQGSEAMRKAGGMPEMYWPFALQAYVHVHNMRPLNSNRTGFPDGVTPFEIFNNVEIEYKKLIKHTRILGCLAYGLVEKKLRGGKQGDHAQPAIFLGYSDEVSQQKGYILQRLSDGHIMVKTCLF